MRYIDTHCHIDLFDAPVAELAQAASANVGVLAVTNAPFVFTACRKLAASQDHVWVAVGLHPELVAQHAHRVDDLIEHLRETRFVGEVGLDYRVTDVTTHRIQREVFARIIQACDERGDAVVSIHSRGAESDAVSMLGSRFNGTAIFHWYSGAAKHLMAAQQNGSFFSVNSSMLASKNGRKLISSMDRTRVLTESDGPFAKINGRRASPRDVPSVIEGLARHWGIETELARSVVMANWASALDS